MIDSEILQWLASQSENVDLRYNAHRESHTTVARHLLHRERLGEPVAFRTDQDRDACIRVGAIWELDVRHQDGSASHLAGPSLKNCLDFAQSRFAAPRSIAA